MRLFTAIQLNGQRAQVYERIQALQEAGVRGNFTRQDNLHLTLVFLGETDRIQDIQRAMDAVKTSCFALSCKGFGCFRHLDVLWMDVHRSPALLQVQAALRGQLETAGFVVENRRYSPHLTLARKVQFPADFNLEAFGAGMEPVRVPVERLSLMCSERIGGRLTYTELYSTPLEKVPGDGGI